LSAEGARNSKPLASNTFRWENRTSATQTWAELQTYLTEKWLERKQYSATTAKKWRFKEAALQAQEAAAAEEEGEMQAILFAML
jgi:nuclear transport factor 2 (NTF2) superfamily protein